MRILFLSGTSVGGAARSTHEIADALRGHGHDVAVLTANDGARLRRVLHKRLLDASVRVGGHPGRAIDAARRSVGASLVAEGDRPYRSWHAARPENALGRLLAREQFDVVVANSLGRPDWRSVRLELERRRIPVVLYLRERNGVANLERERPDLLLANSAGHADAAAKLGQHAIVIPSLVDPDLTRVDSTRERVVFVNPVPIFGLDIALALAAERPDVPFTFVLSWPLDAAATRSLHRDLAPLANVELQSWSSDPRDVYRKARVVLVPYRHHGRPRVVAEAHFSGIPVLGSADDGVAEAVGPGGLCVPVDAPIADWVAALSELWDDRERYDRFVDATRAHAAREEIAPQHIVDEIERHLGDLVDATAAKRS